MSVLVDSDWIIDWLGGFARAQRLLGRLESEGLSISIVTYGEVYEGIYFGDEPEERERRFLGLLANVVVINLDAETMRIFARARGTIRRQGRPIGDGDLLVAATAIRTNQELVTRNVRHFSRVPGLRLYQPA